MKKKIRIVSIAFIILVLLLMYFVAYTYAVDLSNKAIQRAVDNNWKDRNVIEESISDIDIAIKIYPWNNVFYVNKALLQTRTKDYQGLLETNHKLVELNPNKPYYEAQRGLIYDLLRDSFNANIHYRKAQERYENDLKSISQDDYQYQLEYIECLVVSGKEQKAKAVLNRLKIKHPNDEILQIYPIKTKQDIIDQINNNAL